MDTKPLSIFIMNCDWRNTFQKSFVEVRDKLFRDRLNPDLNSFFYFSWSHISYVEKRDARFFAVHKKAPLFFIPLLDFLSCFFAPLSLRKKHVKPDVVFVYSIGFLPAAWIVKKIYGGKIVLCLNNMPTIYSNTRKFGNIKKIYSYCIERLFVGIPEKFFTINTTMLEYLKKMGAPEKKIVIFSMDTIERDKSFIEKSQKGIIKKKYNLPADAKVIITVARLEAEKNYEGLLTLFVALPKNYYLFALGRGSLLTKLEAQCEVLGIRDRVFFTGFVGRDQIWNYYQDADVFVLLSHAEALGVVFWEAMYMHVPVIGSDFSGIIETTGNDGDRGRIWKKIDGEKGFTDRISFCIKESTEKKEMVSRARSFVDKELSNHVVINDIV